MRNNPHSGEMKIQTLNSTRTINDEPPRSTAYYYADLERLKRKDPNGPENGHIPEIPQETVDAAQNSNEFSEYLEANEVVNDGAIREVPPLRDRQYSPEYSTPENRKGETYSTAGTFPMPEPKEKEPLLAELEVVGRLPLTQLETSSVRRSRSWYFCCPDVGEEEASRESSWRYSSLRPVTAPPAPAPAPAPAPRQNGTSMVSASQPAAAAGAGAALRAERDALARALAAERHRAAAAARAHDARLAELHGVIAELVRRRAQDKQACAIPEEEVSDECESTTQPAGGAGGVGGELDTDEPSPSPAPSPAPSPSPSPSPAPSRTDTDTDQNDTWSLGPAAPAAAPAPPAAQDRLHLQELPDADDSSESGAGGAGGAGEPRGGRGEHALCVDSARCCRLARAARGGGGGGGGSCDRSRGSAEGAPVLTASPGRCEARQAKVASRVRLRTTAGAAADDCDSSQLSDEAWCAEAAERLALDVCAQADLREALARAAAGSDDAGPAAALCVWRARCARLQADCRVLRAALQAATDTAHKLSCACAVQESSCVALCCALRAADRALEAYDVLLALAETQHDTDHTQREAAELVGRRLLARLRAEGEPPAPAAVGEPLLSPGPWQHPHPHHPPCPSHEPWTAECEARLRAHAARLKAETVSLRALEPPPQLFSHYDADAAADEADAAAAAHMAEMEAAVVMQEALAAREARAVARARLGAGHAGRAGHAGHAGHAPSDADTARATELHDAKHSESARARARRREGLHWLDPRAAAAETDL